MTDVNGLRLAYRGFVAGLAGAYVWTAIAMLLAAPMARDALAPLRPIAVAISPLARTPELAFLLGFAGVQACGAVVGMSFAYFFARFFTVRPTLVVAAPIVALLVWGLASVARQGVTEPMSPTVRGIVLVATVGFGLILGAGVPIRAEVMRRP